MGWQMRQFQLRAFADQKPHHDGGFLSAGQLGFRGVGGAGRVRACGGGALHRGDLCDCGKLCHLGPLEMWLGHYEMAEVNFRLMV